MAARTPALDDLTMPGAGSPDLTMPGAASDNTNMAAPTTALPALNMPWTGSPGINMAAPTNALPTEPLGDTGPAPPDDIMRNPNAASAMYTDPMPMPPGGMSAEALMYPGTAGYYAGQPYNPMYAGPPQYPG